MRVRDPPKAPREREREREMKKYHYFLIKIGKTPGYAIEFDHSKDDQIDIATQAVVEMASHYNSKVFCSYVDTENDISDHWWCEKKYDSILALSEYFSKKEFDAIQKDAMEILSRTLPFYVVSSCTEWLYNAPCYPKR